MACVCVDERVGEGPGVKYNQSVNPVLRGKERPAVKQRAVKQP